MLFVYSACHRDQSPFLLVSCTSFAFFEEESVGRAGVLPFYSGTVRYVLGRRRRLDWIFFGIEVVLSAPLERKDESRSPSRVLYL